MCGKFLRMVSSARKSERPVCFRQAGPSRVLSFGMESAGFNRGAWLTSFRWLWFMPQCRGLRYQHGVYGSIESSHRLAVHPRPGSLICRALHLLPACRTHGLSRWEKWWTPRSVRRPVSWRIRGRADAAPVRSGPGGARGSLVAWRGLPARCGVRWIESV